MLKFWMDLAMLGAESQQVVALRMLKLAKGGSAAAFEANRMVGEKAIAAQSAAIGMMFGATPASVVKSYRGKVRANRRRLLK
jgi:uncharacterized protein with FMN-binding domain